jgi:CRP-like cAMP-binding protein
VYTLSSNDGIPAKTDLLKQIPLFAGLDEPDLAVMRRALVPKKYAKGEIIFRQGDPGGDLFIIARGKVRIFRLTPGGNETSINLFTRLDIFGEFSILDCEPRSATAQAVEPCVLLTMSGDKFVDYMDRMPKLALGMIRLLVSKARWTAAYAETVAQYDAAGRLLHLLLLYNEQFGEEQIPGKRYVIDLGLNQTELASLVGARREWVNHLLQQWSKRGLVEYASGQVVILDLPRVKEERDSRIESNRRPAEW